jgi:hypothetical protein
MKAPSMPAATASQVRPSIVSLICGGPDAAGADAGVDDLVMLVMASP